MCVGGGSQTFNLPSSPSSVTMAIHSHDGMAQWRTLFRRGFCFCSTWTHCRGEQEHHITASLLVVVELVEFCSWIVSLSYL